MNDSLWQLALEGVDVSRGEHGLRRDASDAVEAVSSVFAPGRMHFADICQECAGRDLGLVR